MDGSSDEELIIKLKAGNGQAFKVLYERYSNKLFNYLNHYTGNRQLAEDVLQDTFIVVYEKIGEYREEGNFQAWLFKIAINFAKKGFRRGKRESLSLSKPFRDTKEDLQNYIPDTHPTISDNLEKIELNKEILKIINKLPANYKQVVLLHDIEGLRYKDIAEIMGVKEAMIGLWLQRARQQLYNLFKSKGLGK